VSLSTAEIASLLAESALPVEPELAERLSTYLALLLKWNARTNLTAIRDPRQIVLRHFADSLFCARHLGPTIRTLLDYGSGAGVPGIPIALDRPEIHVTLAESQNRKAAFLQEAVRTLGLGATVWPQRVESMPPDQLFESITLRAVDQMDSACRTAAERLAPGGHLLVFTTTRLVDSISSAIRNLSWQDPLQLPHSDQGLLLIGEI
jgi:16S rRNA (guanine527-N7)-methyltransferase